jgi:omega-amidase
MSTLRIAICQISVGAVKLTNIDRAATALRRAHALGSQLAVLPECWNCPYSTASFPEFAEVVPEVGETPDPKVSPSIAMLCDSARELGLWLVGGSVPERQPSPAAVVAAAAGGSADAGTADMRQRLFNTCVVVNPQGKIVGKHRKVHLFDIDVPGRIRFKESDALTGGASATVVNTPWGGIGVGICYDIRFPELATIMRQRGAKILIYPGAFNMTTGPAHWELLQRARAVDNQCFVATCSPARDPDYSYVAWGHSTVVGPWGDVLGTCAEGDAVVSADLELARADEMRQNIPCWSQKRTDIYELVDKQA